MTDAVDLYEFASGSAPLLVSIPHCGTYIPPALASAMTPAALEVADTDFHLRQLYDFVGALGVPVLAATHSRYVIDLNRSPEGAVLYPGANNTELCPTTRFDFAQIYSDGAAPDRVEIGQRVEHYWKPYHARLADELQRLRERHGYALLFDAHSIVSVCPRFFEGRLTDFNLGTGGGTTCNARLAASLLDVAQRADRYTSVLNGRFKGGYITRQYGDPANGIHSVQLELSERTYMIESPPFPYDASLAGEVRPVLRTLIDTLLAWKPGQAD